MMKRALTIFLVLTFMMRFLAELDGIYWCLGRVSVFNAWSSYVHIPEKANNMFTVLVIFHNIPKDYFCSVRISVLPENPSVTCQSIVTCTIYTISIAPLIKNPVTRRIEDSMFAILVFVLPPNFTDKTDITN